jgi:hypothetical protein
MFATLVMHPDSRCTGRIDIGAEAVRPRPGRLDLAFFISGGIRDLHIPERTWAGRADELWRRTCFEAFVRGPRAARYLEFNFSPSTQWASYAFSGYRSGMRAARELPAPRLDVHANQETFEMRVSLDLGASDLPPGKPWRIGLAAVIEEANGRRSYWALAHPDGDPDFHHADAFALNLPPGATARETFELI